MDNYAIADQFSLLSKVMDIHGENSFKSKSYSIAAYNIEQLPTQLNAIPREKIAGLKGIGDSTGKKIIEILDTGKIKVLDELISKTPAGIMEMLNIKGLGPKKISLIWKEMEIESLGELLYACQENRLMLYKGFGEKTQNNVADAIDFYMRSQGHFLYAEIISIANHFTSFLKENFPGELVEISGALRRQLPVIGRAEWITTVTPSALKEKLVQNGFSEIESTPTSSHHKSSDNINLYFTHTTPEAFHQQLFQQSSSVVFFDEWQLRTAGSKIDFSNEEKIFESAGLKFIPSYRREDTGIFNIITSTTLPDPIQPEDIKGIIHSHSTWSDGSNSLEEMAKACISKGFEYLVISDHSKTAFYAKGLSEERIREQHMQIDELNKTLAPFRIFKSIESDILNDGSLDYSEPVLRSFDLVIASVHSNLKMSLDKAMMRLLRAIENPNTTILGHMTGRLLLSRNGYPVDHDAIIDACVENKVVIELNAHPRRLDIDWTWINKALEKGAMISIDPDAHSIDGYDDIRYGVYAAQKSLLTPDKNLSSFSRSELEEYLEKRKAARGI
ncbi:helix-hairpin-helix domain-containing protein [Pollutibacter soli]|uniref:helix-hairpin-helix domain-containing protein n=1 Tax=Pollutibacter soli TaxID=3034157 RepID=UPI0030141B23